MATLFTLGSVGVGLPHAENTRLVISDTAKVQQISFPATLFHTFFHISYKKNHPELPKPTIHMDLNFFVRHSPKFPYICTH